jgi:hypothetical protein
MFLVFDRRPKTVPPEQFVGFFDEKPNHRSSTRLMSFYFMLGFFAFGGVACMIPAVKDIAIPLAMTSGGYAVVGKQVGKGLEQIKGGEQEAELLP